MSDDPQPGDGGTLPPLEVDLVVAGPPAHAFDLWTARTALWWPASHTVSGNPARIVFEPVAGGRIYELGPDGAEHPWGEIVAFEPPRRISYRWHLFFDRSEATLVEVTFDPTPDGTRVRLVQTGWDALGDQGRPRRDRTAMAWSHITDVFGQAADGGGTPPTWPQPAAAPATTTQRETAAWPTSRSAVDRAPRTTRGG